MLTCKNTFNFKIDKNRVWIFMDFNRCFGKKTTNIIMKCNMNKNSVPVLICYFSADSPYILALIHIYSIN